MIRIISYVVVCLGLLAIASSVFFDWSEFTKVLVTTPGLVALIGALYELLRDNLAHERQLILRRRKEIFDAGFASHMAEVAFNKQVEFCEEYIEAVNNTIRMLWQKGPNPKALEAAGILSGIRQLRPACQDRVIAQQSSER